MDQQQIISYLKDNDIHKVKFAFADIDGILRGKIISTEKFLDGLHDGYGFCDVVFGWDSSDAVYDNTQLTGWHTGYPDRPARIDLSTFRTIPWQDNIPFFIADFSRFDGSTIPACSRSLLKRITAECEGMGYHPEFSQEFEWFNFRETSQSLHDKSFRDIQTLTSGMFGYSILRTSQNSEFYYDLFNLLQQFNIPLDGLHTETGPGVYEAAIVHDHVLIAADKAALFKIAVKEIADMHGIMASFMAKWNENLPGCSGHVHQSLWDKRKSKNLFYSHDDEHHMSDILKH
ncbi:MAG: glutamine synthetase, partial [Bacteroidetes bacterium]|nr:glutamine synthetase [Bacteroidota bacterium]